VQIKDWAAIAENEEEIAQQLVNVGPLSIGLNASMLQFYRKGVFDPLRCNPSILNHAVLLVGYGTSDKGKDFWTVKNSWGLKWGEDGFFRIARGKGKCGVNTLVATAIL
jgi:cathepsin F